MVTSAVFDAEAAASRVVAALLPLADAQRAGQGVGPRGATWIRCPA